MNPRWSSENWDLEALEDGSGFRVTAWIVEELDRFHLPHRQYGTWSTSVLVPNWVGVLLGACKVSWGRRDERIWRGSIDWQRLERLVMDKAKVRALEARWRLGASLADLSAELGAEEERT